MKVAFIGCGGIAGDIVSALQRENLAAQVRVIGALARPSGTEAGSLRLREVTIHGTLEDLLRCRPHIVAEVASQEAVRLYGETVLSAGCDLLIASVGALADEDLAARLKGAAQAGGARIIIPAGAIGGIDAIGAHRLANLRRVLYRSIKPVKAWEGTPASYYIDLKALDGPRCFYAGSAREAATRFPQNANVAGTVALAGIGFDRTEVELIADPAAAGNRHQIVAESDVGRVELMIESKASLENPKTSALTALSLTRALMNECGRLVI